MTRKEALSIAIQAISDTKENQEAITVLQSLSDDLPFVHWSEDAIHDSIRQFILENGRNPTCTDFKKRGMPPHTVIQNRYGISLREWLDTNYPTQRPDPEMVKAKNIKAFRTEYHRIRPKSAEEFNKYKRPHIRSWVTIAHYCGVKSWRKLLSALDLPVYTASDTRKPTAMQVHIISDIPLLPPR